MSLQGTMIADDRGFVIETTSTQYDEPFLIISRYRVTVMNGRPRSEREPVRFDGSVWSGLGFQCNTDNQPPESGERIPMKKPRGKKVWCEGSWETKHKSMCTCRGRCKGSDGLGENYQCALEQRC